MPNIYKLNPLGGVLYVGGEFLTIIPAEAENIDWQAYQAWLSEGNQPDPAYTLDELEEQGKLVGASREIGWRDAELPVIARQLQAIEEDEVDETPPDLLPGTRKQWLRYRGQVSNWKEGIEPFPDLARRPIRPA